MTMHDSNFLKKSWNFLTFGIAYIFSALTKKDLLDLVCFKIKVDNCEIGIKNGGILSVLGDLQYDTRTKKMIVLSPLRLMKNKIESLLFLKRKVNYKTLSTFFFWVSSISFGAASLICFYNALQERDYLTIFRRRFQVPMFFVNKMRNLKKMMNSPFQ